MRNILELTKRYIFRLWSMYFWFLIFVIMWGIIGWIMSKHINLKLDYGLTILSIFIWLAKKITQLKIHFRFLDILRAKDNTKHELMLHPLQFHAHLFKDLKFNSRTCAIGIVKLFYSILWSIPCLFMLLMFVLTGTLNELWWIAVLLGIIPIYKYYYTYGLAQYIYQDGDKAGQMVTILNSPKLSKLLINHHIIPYMLLQLEVTLPTIIMSLAVGFIMYISVNASYLALPYAELSSIGAFILIMLMIAPYLKLTELQYYQELINERVNDGSKLYKAIMNK